MRLAFVVFLLSLSLFAGNLTWHSTYDEAFDTAKKEHKFLMLFLTQPGCKTCAYMREKTLKDPRVTCQVPPRC
jgi:thioredoxin-related protein